MSDMCPLCLDEGILWSGDEQRCWPCPCAASAMSAFGQDPQGLEAKPASAVGEAETPNDLGASQGIVELLPCPFCGTRMLQHEHCFSHPRASGPDCVLRHYSFGNEHTKRWNTRAAMPDSTQLLQTMAGALEEARGDVDFACTAIMKLHEQKARNRLEQTLRRLDTALAQFRAQEQRS